jgi:hypothetical protein
LIAGAASCNRCSFIASETKGEEVVSIFARALLHTQDTVDYVSPSAHHDPESQYDGLVEVENRSKLNAIDRHKDVNQIPITGQAPSKKLKLTAVVEGSVLETTSQ